jgi:hypothetical protein
VALGPDDWRRGTRPLVSGIVDIVPSPQGAHASVRAPSAVYCGGREPLFIAALAFASGIVVANFVWRPPLIWLIAATIAAAGVCVLHRRAPAFAFALAILALVPLGAFYLQVTDAAQVTPPNLAAFATGEGTVDVTAHVMREGIVRESPFGGKQESVDVETEQLISGDYQSSASVGIRLTIYTQRAEEEEARDSGTEAALPVYTYGERLHYPAKLRAPRNYGNPGALDLVGYLASQGVRLTGSARARDVEILPGFAWQPDRTLAQQRPSQRAQSHPALVAG